MVVRAPVSSETFWLSLLRMSLSALSVLFSVDPFCRYHCLCLVGQYVKKADLGTRTTTISVGTRKYGKIRAPVPSADTGTGSGLRGNELQAEFQQS